MPDSERLLDVGSGAGFDGEITWQDLRPASGFKQVDRVFVIRQVECLIAASGGEEILIGNRQILRCILKSSEICIDRLKVAVERIEEYTRLETEAPRCTNSDKQLVSGWPVQALA